MIIRSKRVWLSGVFFPADVEIEGGKIAQIWPYGTKEADQDYELRHQEMW